MADNGTPPFDFESHRAKAREGYGRVRAQYEGLAECVKSIIGNATDSPLLKIQKIEARAKTLDSFVEKACRPSSVNSDQPKYADPLSQIRDKAGVRVITFLPRTLPEVEKCLQEQFVVLERVDHIAKAQEEERLGYLSVHYLVKLRDERTRLPEYARFRGLEVEIQVRTVMQHAWAEIEHDIQYKSAAAIPVPIRRRFMALAGMLEMVDREFQAIQDADDDLRQTARRAIKSGHLEGVEITPDALRVFLDDRLGVDNRIAGASYEWTADILRGLGFGSFAEIRECIDGYDDDAIGRAVFGGGRRGQLARFESLLLASMGDYFVRNHPWSGYPWFDKSVLEQLERLKSAGVAIGSYRPSARHRGQGPDEPPPVPGRVFRVQRHPPQPKTASELFDKLVPEGLAKFPERARLVNAIYCFDIPGDGGGTWTADLTTAPPTCVRGKTKKAQCTISVASQDFAVMLRDPQAGMQLYFEGKLKVTGDPMLVTKLQEFFQLAAEP